MIYLLGDTQIRREQPFADSILKLGNWLTTIVEEGSTIIQLGDLLHRDRPFPSENELLTEFLKILQSKDIRMNVIRGNHGEDTTYYENSLKAHKEELQCIYWEPELVIIDKVSFAVLPWIPHYALPEETKNLKQYYEEWVPENKPYLLNTDFLLYHFADETQSFGGKKNGIDLSKYFGKRIGGDIHLQTDHYLGVPFPTRADEKHQQGRIMRINETNGSLEYISIPWFHDYKELEFGQDDPSTSEMKYILDVINAPSKEEVYKKYPLSLIHSYSLKKLEGEATISNVGNHTSLGTYWNSFKSKKKLPKEVADYIESKLVWE